LASETPAILHLSARGAVATIVTTRGIFVLTGTLTGNTADGNLNGFVVGSILDSIGKSTLIGNTASNNGTGFNVG
jgi:parallel beta-helix repeat protein